MLIMINLLTVLLVIEKRNQSHLTKGFAILTVKEDIVQLNVFKV